MKNKISALFLGVVFVVIMAITFQLSGLYSPISEVLLSNEIGEWTKYSIFTVHEVIIVLSVYLALVFLIKSYKLVTYNFSSIVLIQLPILLFFFKENILSRDHSLELLLNPYIISSLLVTILLMFGLVAIYTVDKRYFSIKSPS